MYAILSEHAVGTTEGKAFDNRLWDCRIQPRYKHTIFVTNNLRKMFTDRYNTTLTSDKYYTPLMHLIPFYWQKLNALKAEYQFFALQANIAHITAGYNIKFTSGRHRDISSTNNITLTQKRTGDVRIFQTDHPDQVEISINAETVDGVLPPFSQSDIEPDQYNFFMRQNKQLYTVGDLLTFEFPQMRTYTPHTNDNRLHTDGTNIVANLLPTMDWSYDSAACNSKEFSCDKATD